MKILIMTLLVSFGALAIDTNWNTLTRMNKTDNGSTIYKYKDEDVTCYIVESVKDGISYVSGLVIPSISCVKK